MNLFSRFLDLNPKRIRYYGTIISKDQYTTTINLLGGGLVRCECSTDLDVGSKVWLEVFNGSSNISIAPNLQDGGEIEIEF